MSFLNDHRAHAARSRRPFGPDHMPSSHHTRDPDHQPAAPTIAVGLRKLLLAQPHGRDHYYASPAAPRRVGPR